MNLRITALLTSILLLLSVSCMGESSQDSSAPYRDPEALAELIASDEPYILIDVRRDDEFQRGYIPTSINIPVDSIAANPPDIPRDSTIILYCQSGVRSARALSLFKELGFTDLTDFGAIGRWPYDLENFSP